MPGAPLVSMNSLIARTQAGRLSARTSSKPSSNKMRRLLSNHSRVRRAGTKYFFVRSDSSQAAKLRYRSCHVDRFSTTGVASDGPDSKRAISPRASSNKVTVLPPPGAPRTSKERPVSINSSVVVLPAPSDCARRPGSSNTRSHGCSTASDCTSLCNSIIALSWTELSSTPLTQNCPTLPASCNSTRRSSASAGGRL